MVFFIVDNAELTGRNTLHGRFGMHDIAAIGQWFELCAMIFGRVPNLKSDVKTIEGSCQ